MRFILRCISLIIPVESFELNQVDSFNQLIRARSAEVRSLAQKAPAMLCEWTFFSKCNNFRHLAANVNRFTAPLEPTRWVTVYAKLDRCQIVNRCDVTLDLRCIHCIHCSSNALPFSCSQLRHFEMPSLEAFQTLRDSSRFVENLGESGIWNFLWKRNFPLKA